MYYKPIYKLVQILQKGLTQDGAKEGKTELMYPWSMCMRYQIVSKLTVFSEQSYLGYNLPNCFR
jgi:hypothetical protein